MQNLIELEYTMKDSAPHVIARFTSSGKEFNIFFVGSSSVSEYSF